MAKRLPRIAGNIGVYANDEEYKVAVSARHKLDLPQSTEQQIDDYCEKVLNLSLICRNEGALMFEGVQIIRQLQKQTDRIVR